MFSSDKILATNPRCVLKTEIVDNTEPQISVLLGNSLIYYGINVLG